MSKKKKKVKNIGSKIFAYVMLALAVVSALTSIIAYMLH
ncbi:unknown [Clostridium sp. CAG:302]|nr:unknown [Clostridium sp. CAG:302]